MFLEIEGIEGAGKTTQCLLLNEWMTKKGLDSIVVKELGSTSFSKKVRRILVENGMKDSRAEMFLFLSCKSQVFSQMIMPYLAQSKHVISDRGSGSFISYNSSILGLDKDILTDFLNVAMSGIRPTLTILPDIPVEIAMKRIETRPEKTRFDMIGEVYLDKQRNKFVELANHLPNWVSIDGLMPISDVHLEIIKHVEKLL